MSLDGQTDISHLLSIIKILRQDLHEQKASRNALEARVDILEKKMDGYLAGNTIAYSDSSIEYGVSEQLCLNHYHLFYAAIYPCLVQ